MDELDNQQKHTNDKTEFNSDFVSSDGTELQNLNESSVTLNNSESELADTNKETETVLGSENEMDSDQGLSLKTRSPKAKKHGGWWVLGAILFVVLALAFGVWSGYSRGVGRRVTAQKDNQLTIAAQQLTLAYEDLDKNQLDTAKQRIEYILKIYPDFPGAQEMLVDIQMRMGLPTHAAPTLALPPLETPTGPTSTPDLRGVDELFNATKALVSEQKWAEALVNILSLRERYYDYKTAQVDGFYYVSLRNDGINKIYSGKLEQGIWELNEAAQIGALDNQAAGAITLANMYVTGASYWDNNWPEAIRIFDELRQTYPNLTDATGMSTTERYRVALYKQGALFAAQNDFCTALDYYQRSLAVAPDQQIAAQATIAETECNKPAPTAIVTPTIVTPDALLTQTPGDVPIVTPEAPATAEPPATVVP